jgi:DNA-binding LacI/PurR family transcriptional regulator
MANSDQSVSLQDIARVAGVSHTTVSRALRDNPVISLEVRKRIQELAIEMGYTPNAIAQSLKGQRSNTIGLVVTSIADPFVGRVVRGIEGVAQKAGIGIILSVSNNNPDQEMNVIEYFHRRRVDGIITVASKVTTQYRKRLERIKVPTVLINQQAEIFGDLFHSVSVDDYQGAYLAVDYLASLGHQSIGYLGVDSRPRSNRRRLEGYHAALAAAGIMGSEKWIKIASSTHYNDDEDDDVNDGKALLPALIQAGISAVFCYNDMIAIGALMACRELGIQVPQRLSIVGFDNVPFAQYITPPLTTIHQPKLRLGQIAMEMILSLFSDDEVNDTVLPTEIVVRETTSRGPF